MDVHKAIHDYFLGFRLPKAMCSTSIMLLPKKDSSRTFADYRPISLSNFMAKVRTRISTTRLATILPHLISEEQAGFMRGRDISEHIFLAQEMTYYGQKVLWR